jgi:glycosyltransferase involved in cell wall biosynthesis
MRVIVASVRTPFVQGGAEIHAEQLIKALLAAGHQAELVTIPFNAGNPERIPDQMLTCALMDLNEINEVKVDRLIALKFPAYLVPHPNKVVWLMHQYRPAYDLWNNSLGNLHSAARGVIVRDIILRADAKMCQEVKRLFTVSKNVSRRLRDFWNVDSTPLYHPPAGADHFYCADETDDYIFYPSRISINKRQDLVLRALALTRYPVRLRFAGIPDSPSYGESLRRLEREVGVDSRVEWVGFLSEKEKRDTYAHSLAVVYPTFDEDYGYITLEAMLASKAVITCDDSGGPLEFVLPNKTGLITPADPDHLAAAMDTLWHDRDLAKKLGRAGRARYDVLGLSWAKVVKQLLA